MVFFLARGVRGAGRLSLFLRRIATLDKMEVATKKLVDWCLLFLGVRRFVFSLQNDDLEGFLPKSHVRVRIQVKFGRFVINCNY